MVKNTGKLAKLLLLGISLFLILLILSLGAFKLLKWNLVLIICVIIIFIALVVGVILFLKTREFKEKIQEDIDDIEVEKKAYIIFQEKYAIQPKYLDVNVEHYGENNTPIAIVITEDYWDSSNKKHILLFNWHNPLNKRAYFKSFKIGKMERSLITQKAEKLADIPVRFATTRYRSINPLGGTTEEEIMTPAEKKKLKEEEENLGVFKKEENKEENKK